MMLGIMAQQDRAIEDRLRFSCEPLTHKIDALRAVIHGMHVVGNGGGQASGHSRGIKPIVTHRGCDAAVLASRAKWESVNPLWGSTARDVMRSVQCSVLAIRPSSPEDSEQPAPS